MNAIGRSLPLRSYPAHTRLSLFASHQNRLPRHYRVDRFLRAIASKADVRRSESNYPNTCFEERACADVMKSGPI
jgi:hypothetical protein